jgi:hypothetical protein
MFAPRGFYILMKKSIAALKITNVIIQVFVTLMASAFLLDGCGKKAMPEPPSGRRPPKVTDLSYSISENDIKLSWSIPKTNAEARSPIAGFFIYRSKQSHIEADCPNCPIRYLRIGEVLVRRGAPGQSEPAVVYTDTIEPGYRYIYKVEAYDDDSITGRDSNVIDFMY